MSANGVNNACEKYPPAESDEPDKLPLTDTNCKDISRNNKGESYLDLSAGKLEMLSKESKSQGTISEEPNISVSDCGKKLAKDADTRNKSVSSIESLEAEMMKGICFLTAFLRHPKPDFDISFCSNFIFFNLSNLSPVPA